MLLQVNVRAPEGKRHRSPGRMTYPELERLVRARGDWPGLPSKAALLAPCAWGAGYEYKTPFKVLVDENNQPVAYDDPARARAGGLVRACASCRLRAPRLGPRLRTALRAAARPSARAGELS